MKRIILPLLILTCSMAICQEVRLVSFESSDCEEEKGIGDSIIFKKQKKDVLSIKITAEFNCCGSVYGTVELKKNILNLKYEDYSEEYCNCICYYEYEYTIKGIKNQNYEVYINGTKIE